MNFHKNSLSRSRKLFVIIQRQLRIKSQHIRNRMEFFELDKEHQCTKKKKTNLTANIILNDGIEKADPLASRNEQESLLLPLPSQYSRGKRKIYKVKD